MASRRRTAFDKYLDTQLKDAGFAREYAAARGEIDSVDAFVRLLDARREALGFSKAELAVRVGMKPEVVRRLFTASEPNPTLDTVVRLASALGCSLDLAPQVGRRVRKLAAREVRR
jgi:ribosome-binding protein aMBF1 (putative translation factor)